MKLSWEEGDGAVSRGVSPFTLEMMGEMVTGTGRVELQATGKSEKEGVLPVRETVLFRETGDGLSICEVSPANGRQTLWAWWNVPNVFDQFPHLALKTGA